MSGGDRSAGTEPTREGALRALKERILATSHPRFEMLALVALTGALGFLASWALLRLGLRVMALRYPLAVAGRLALEKGAKARRPRGGRSGCSGTR